MAGRPGEGRHAAGGPLVWAPGRGAHRRRAAGPSWTTTHLATLVLPAALVLVGAAVRVEQLVAHRSLWPDEAMLAANIVHRGFAGLLRPLAFQQGAPVGFLWAERAAVLVLGNNEYALTVVPLVAGLVTLVLAWAVGRRLLSPWATAALLVLVCLNPALVFYATEAKQYSVDVACTLAVVLAGIAVLAGRAALSRRRLVTFAVVGAVVVWFSHAGVLVAATMAVLVVVRAACSRSRTAAAGALAAAGVVGLSIGLDYAGFLSHLSQDGYLRSYWSAGFVPRPSSPASVMAWLGRAATELVDKTAGLGLPALAVALAVLGIAVVARRRGWASLALIAVGLGALGGAMSGRYPVNGRLGLFTLPALMVSVAGTLDAGLLLVRRRLGRHTRRALRHRAPPSGAGAWADPGPVLAGRTGVTGAGLAGRTGVTGAGLAARTGVTGAGLAARVAAAGLVAVVVAHPLAGTRTEAAHPIRVSEVRPLFAFVKAHLRRGDAIDLDPGAGDVWHYYAPTVGLSLPATVLMPASRGGTCASPSALRPPPGDHRLWVVFGYPLSFAPSDELRIYLARLALVGRPVLRRQSAHASLYLFDLYASPMRRAGPLPGAPGVRCLVPVHQAVVPPTGLRAGPLGTGGMT